MGLVLDPEFVKDLTVLVAAAAAAGLAMEVRSSACSERGGEGHVRGCCYCSEAHSLQAVAGRGRAACSRLQASVHLMAAGAGPATHQRLPHCRLADRPRRA